MLVRSPTLTKRLSSVIVSGSRPESRITGCDARRGSRRRLALDRRGDGGDVLGRGAAAAADEVEQAGLGELGQDRGRLVGRLVVLAEGVGQAGVGVARRRRCRRAATARRRRGASRVAPRAQLRPTASGRAWRIESQNASVTWPDSVRPDASVMVPEMITGQRRPCSSKSVSTAKIAALALRVSKIVSISSRSAPPSTQAARGCSR